MSSVSLQDCFELFTQEETLEGDERPVSVICCLDVVFCSAIFPSLSYYICSVVDIVYCVWLFFLKRRRNFDSFLYCFAAVEQNSVEETCVLIWIKCCCICVRYGSILWIWSCSRLTDMFCVNMMWCYRTVLMLQTCARCQKRQKCTKRLSIQKFPQILIIRIFSVIGSMV